MRSMNQYEVNLVETINAMALELRTTLSDFDTRQALYVEQNKIAIAVMGLQDMLKDGKVDHPGARRHAIEVCNEILEILGSKPK